MAQPAAPVFNVSVVPPTGFLGSWTFTPQPCRILCGRLCFLCHEKEATHACAEVLAVDIQCVGDNHYSPGLRTIFLVLFPAPYRRVAILRCPAPPGSCNSEALGATAPMRPSQFRPPCPCAFLRFPSLIKDFFVRRAEDYWLGYKFFCFAYYSHSPPHVLQFRESKLGSIISPPPPDVSLFLCNLQFCFNFVSGLLMLSRSRPHCMSSCRATRMA